MCLKHITYYTGTVPKSDGIRFTRWSDPKQIISEIKYIRKETTHRSITQPPLNCSDGHDLKVTFNFYLVVSKILNNFQNRFTGLLISLYSTDESTAARS